MAFEGFRPRSIPRLAMLIAGLLLFGGVAQVVLPGTAHASGDREIVLRVGESTTLYLGRIKSAEVGNPEVIEAKPHPTDKAIIIFGLKEGYSSLTVGSFVYDVNVVGDSEQLRRDIETLLLDIPGVDVLNSGSKVVIDGVVKRRDDLERVKQIAAANKARVYSLVLLDERDIVKKAQIQLHFQVLEINRTRDHDIGVNWNAGPVQLVMDSINFIQFGPGMIQSPIIDPADPLSTVRKTDDLFNLKSQVDVQRVLDKDFFTVMSGEEVKFHRGKELIFVSEGFNGQIITKLVGLTVEAKPVIDDDGDIDMLVEVRFSTVGKREFDGTIPAINTQVHKSRVQLRAGESFAMSGFFRREKGRTISGLPGLKDIPGLGVLFGSRAWQRGDSDGIIVLTPVLLDPDRRSMRKQIKETLDLYDAADVKW